MMRKLAAILTLLCGAAFGQTEYPFPVFQTDGFSFYTLNDEDISGADMHVTSTPALIVEMPTTMDEATVLDLTTPRLVWADTGGRLNHTVGAAWDAALSGIYMGAATAASWPVLGAVNAPGRLVVHAQDTGGLDAGIVSILGDFAGNNSGSPIYLVYHEGTFGTPAAVDTATVYPLAVVSNYGSGGTPSFKLPTSGLFHRPTTSGALTFTSTMLLGTADALEVSPTGAVTAYTLTIDSPSGTTLQVDADANIGGTLDVAGNVDIGGGDWVFDAAAGTLTGGTGSDLTLGTSGDISLANGGRIGVGITGSSSDVHFKKSSEIRVDIENSSSSGGANLFVMSNWGENFRLYGGSTGAAGTLAGITRAGNGIVAMGGSSAVGIGTENAIPFHISTSNVIRVTVASDGYATFVQGINAGTATDAAGQGDIAAGLTGAARIHYDQSDGDLDGYDSGGALSWKIDATAGGATVFNEDSDDIDFRIETDSEANAVVVDAGSNALTVNSWFGVGNESSLTIASGAVTATHSRIVVDTEAAAASDDLDTINFTGGKPGDILIVGVADSGRTVVLKDGTGNLKLAGDFTGDNADDHIVLMRQITELVELSRSDNGA